MDKLIYTAMTGAKSLMLQQAAVSNNLANADSTGFRAEVNRLRAVPVQSESLPSRAFVVDAGLGTNFSEGPMKFTGRNYDVAVQGKGFFAIRTADGKEAYTRDGSFTVSADGVLQTRSGQPVMGDGGPITIPPDNEIAIGKDGTISATPSSGAVNTVNVVGRLKLVNPSEQNLERGDDGLFRTKDGQPLQLDENVQVASGYLEGSNVNVAEEMVQMISLSRQFEMQTSMLTNAQDNDKAAVQMMNAR